MTATGGIATGGGTRWWRRWIADTFGSLATLLRAPRLPPGRRLTWSSPRRLLEAVLVTVLMIGVTAILFDNRAISFCRTLPRWLVQAFDDFSDLGKAGWFLMPTGFLLFVISVCLLRRLPHVTRLVLAALAVRLAFVFLAVGLPALFTSLAKHVIGRARPSFTGGEQPLVLLPLMWRHEYSSMPSGHGTNVFAAAIAIGALWPRARPVIWTYAVLIGASRVVITTHYPSDIIASAFVGMVGALLVRDWFAARRLGFVVDAHGRVRTLPGPSWRRVGAVARKVASA